MFANAEHLGICAEITIVCIHIYIYTVLCKEKKKVHLPMLSKTKNHCLLCVYKKKKIKFATMFKTN